MFCELDLGIIFVLEVDQFCFFMIMNEAFFKSAQLFWCGVSYLVYLPSVLAQIQIVVIFMECTGLNLIIEGLFGFV